MEEDKILERLKSAMASVEMEGYTFTKEEEELLLKDAREEIPDIEFEKMVLEMIKKKGK